VIVTDRIEKRILLRAPQEQVWRAISDAEQFGFWFGVRFDKSFAEGARLTATIVPTQVNAAVAKSQQPYAGTRFEFIVERIEPMRHFSFRWHPFAVQPGSDVAKEPTTLVVFELEAADAGILLTITESGFDRIAPERRAKAFAANEQGWEKQTQLVEKYLAMSSQR
jgi:uncharacterized protein YndB with AHSA1/START domain